MSTAVSARRPRRVIARAVALSGTALLAAALLAWSPQPATGWNQSSAEATLWQLLNGARVNNGLQPLTQHSTLVSLAQWRSKDMIDRNYFSHTILGTSWEVYHWYDSNGLSWVSGGENIGWNNGYSDADSPIKIHEGFMNSPGHRANVLNTSWSHGGVGAYAADDVDFLGKLRDPRVYTELFIQLKSAPPPPPPATPAPTAPPATPKPTAAPTVQPTAVPTAKPTAPPTPQPTSLPSPSDATATPTTGPLAESLPPDLPSASGAPSAASTPAETPAVAGSLRVESAQATDRGIFESVIGALLGFFLG